ncbi:hypothetical protein BD779DRAFT_1508890 [Infundibulicybe gibba]|nr:hypothetical protein BD779DRAFT_1508890 [Infundibulicybe gibba]
MVGDAPLLQSLKCEVSFPEETFPIPLRMVHGCPRLESFEWGGFGSPLLPPLHTTSLTSLRLGTDLAVSESIAILRLSPRLCSAEFYNSYLINSSSTPRLIHPTLHTLTAAGQRSITLLDALTLPALLKLDLRPEYRITPLSTEWEITLSAFLQRSGPTLRELLTMIYMPEDMLLRILALTPHLRILKLRDSLPLLTGALIRALHPPPPPGIPLCPRLQMLELPRVLDCPDGLCAAMLHTRWGTQAYANKVACLEWVRIGFEGGRHDRDEVDMNELCDEGMQGKIYLIPR